MPFFITKTKTDLNQVEQVCAQWREEQRHIYYVRIAAA